MKKVKNPRSDLSWSEITLVLIKKTIRLVLGSRVAEICSVFEGGLTDVIVVLLLLLSSSSPALVPPFPPPLAYVPLWVASSPGVAASAVAVCGFAWVVCLAQDLLHVHGRGNAGGSGLRGRLCQSHFSMSRLTMAVVPLPTASSFCCTHSELNISMDWW